MTRYGLTPCPDIAVRPAGRVPGDAHDGYDGFHGRMVEAPEDPEWFARHDDADAFDNDAGGVP